jgi:group I intron endonuclease
MKIDVNNLEDLLKSGVYLIKNIINNKVYIGSTKMSIHKRVNHHIGRLRINTHKNAHLQNSYNKYGEDNFIIEILEITDKNDTLIREQYWINNYKENNKILYNINPLATGPDLSKETIEKRRQTMLKKYASGEFDHIKEKLKNRIPWNKGKKYESTEHLKVSKNKKGDRDNFSKNCREKLPEIYVYDLNKSFIAKWNCSKDIEDWSITDENNYPIKSRFNTERMGKPIKLLQSVNINKSCKTGKPYKGLYFSYKPFNLEID